jgi:hypothetical protein
MNIALWMAATLLAAVSLTVGAMKLAVPREKLAEHMAWAGHFSDAGVRWIGVLEVLAAIGLVVPGALGVAPVLVPLAATGSVALQIGAAVTNVRYDEVNRIPINVVLSVLAVFVAWGRFGPYPL